MKIRELFSSRKKKTKIMMVIFLGLNMGSDSIQKLINGKLEKYK
jgi:hypothetical protein